MNNPTQASQGQLKYLDASQVAERLPGATKKWVQLYTRLGVIPGIKVGRKTFYTEDGVDAALAALQAQA